MGSPPGRQVYAIRYATRSGACRAEHFYRGDPNPNEQMPIDYYVWAIVEPDRAVLVDTGFTARTAQRRGSRQVLRSPLETLANLGIAASAVTDLVLTHLHYDHTGHADQFPNARVHLQREEFEFWTGPMATRGDAPHLSEQADLDFIRDVFDSGEVQLLEGDAPVTEGILLHRVGGHSAGLQIVSVETDVGRVVLASDASHFYENICEDRPYSIVHHLPSMFAAFDLVKELATSPDLIIPGHDPLVIDRFPPVPGLGGLAVRIA